MNTAVAVLLAVCFLLYITEGRHNHSHSHEHGGERPPKPAFLKNLNETLREEFWSIVKDKTLQPSEKRAKVLAWGEKYGLQSREQKAEVNVRKRISSMDERNMTGKECLDGSSTLGSQPPTTPPYIALWLAPASPVIHLPIDHDELGNPKETQEHEDRVAAWWAARKGSTAPPV
ncbi:unnamed protein product [Haemonchus placei]|uniref:DUF148 domain-containing protein n=1 Tax=Haemonchus placei TaxID=6290 RepID=A0A0N4WBQ5_HAEPC|nr:unnamed protein product [Haemonchus placei]